MENLVFSLNATMPVFLMIFLGWFLKRIHILNDSFIAANNKLVFNVLFPILLFRDIAATDLGDTFNMRFVVFCFVVTCICFGLTWLVAALTIKDRASIGSFVVSSCRGSAAVLGVVFATNIYGSAGMVPMMIIASVPLYNIFSVVLMTIYSRADGKKIDVKSILKGVVTNPLIIGIVLGVPFALLHVQFPTIIGKTLDYCATMTSPLALLVVGAEFEFGAAKGNLKLSSIATAIKLVVQPLIFLPIAVWMGFRGEEIVALIIMLGAPTTVAAYIMAKSMNNNAELVSSSVVLTTLVSALTVTAWVYVTRCAGII